MRRPFQIVLCLLLLVGGVTAAHAWDIVGMPTGNLSPPRYIDFSYIYLTTDLPPGAPDFVSVYELYYKVCDRLEIGQITFVPEGGGADTELNLAGVAVEETADHPSLILGVFNALGEDILGTDDVSPYVLSAYNVHVPSGPPRLQDPLVRVHLGYGTGIHMDKLFGGVQVKVTPDLGFAILNYQSSPAYMATYEFAKKADGSRFEITLGTLGGNEFARLGATAHF